jgi:peptide/nickel transport system ATP-binding protein
MIDRNREILIELRNLKTYFFTEDGVVKAVDGVDFTVGRGEVLGLVGESGCGKSVTSLSIMRLISPPGKVMEGEIYFEGKDLLKISEADMVQMRGNRMSMIFQQPQSSLNPVFKVGDQVAEVLSIHQGMNKQQSWERAVDLLRLVGIPDPEKKAHAYPHEMSGGQAQRVMIAMALALKPQLLIADEPTTALDVTIQAQILDLMRDLRNRMDTSVILITHDLGVIAEIAERVLVMYAGFIVEEASVDDLFEDPRHPYTQALLAALPRVDRRRDKRLQSIPGAPPNLLVPPTGCPFVQRCQFAFSHCKEEMPALIEVGFNHQAACWLDVTTGNER